LLHSLYIHSSCRPSCCGQAGPDEAEEDEVEKEDEGEEGDTEGVARLSNFKHPFNSCHPQWLPALDVNLRHDVLDNCPIHDIIHLVLELVDSSLDAGATDIRTFCSSKGV
jgi:hypothetical protein